MSPLERLSRNTLMIVPVVVVWLFLYGATLLYVEEAALPSAALLVLAVLVTAGLPPRSFLRSPLDRLATAAARGQKNVLVFLALASPCLLMAFASLLAYSFWNYQRFATQYGIRSSEQTFPLVLSLIAALVGLIFLIANVAILARAPRARG